MYNWLTKKLNIIRENISLGASLSQAFYLTGCSGIIPEDIPTHSSPEVRKILVKYKFQKEYIERLTAYFSTLIEYLPEDFEKEYNADVQSYFDVSIDIQIITNYFRSVQQVLDRDYVFKFCLVNKKRQLYHSPAGFWSSNFSAEELVKDSLYTLFVISQEKTEEGLLQKRKFFYPPFSRPELGYLPQSFEGEFRVFYPKKDDVVTVREKIMSLTIKK
jgi:DNA-dependent RNA polymerase auxiliary subunit epsilon